MKIKLNILLVILILLVSIISCIRKKNDINKGELLNCKYSTGFDIFKLNDGYILKVKNRYDRSDSNSREYFLTTNEKEIKDNSTIRIPVKKVVCLSTTHCAFISKLDEISSIKGISGLEYVYDSFISNMINKSDIVEVGYDNQINYEKIISISPDVVFAYGVDNSSISFYQKLTDIGIPVVFVNDFIESLPLGRTEWIKFFGCFYNKFDVAVEYFDSVECNYNKLLLDKLHDTANRPRVLVGLPWKGVWWIPGGDSYFANFIKDAGAKYFLEDNSKSESIPYTIEEVFSIANDIDIWLNPNSANNREEIIQIDGRLQKFNPIYRSKIYNNTKRLSKNGGNDFWESGVVHPDIILKDLQSIFYPTIDTLYSLIYYKKLN